MNERTKKGRGREDRKRKGKGGEERRRKRRGVEKKEGGGKEKNRKERGRFSHHDMYRRQDCSAARCKSSRSS
jgi:hypothetical protein